MQKLEDKNEFTKYEIARILGARALQISMNAPLLLKLSKEELERLNYDPLKIAELELKENILPISIKRPLPQKHESELKRQRDKASTDKEKEKLEEREEGEIEKEGEIMELARPDDEYEEEAEEASDSELE